MIKMIGKRIKDLRTMQSMNQRDFSSQIGVNQSTLSAYENGNALPSVDVLVTIAKTFNVSLDWLCGVSQERAPVSTLDDFIHMLFELDRSDNLRFEVEVDDYLPEDFEADDRKRQAAIKFFGNDHSHPLNADICEFLSAFKVNRQAFETYLASKEQYLWWQKYMLDKFGHSFLTKKQYEDIPESQRIALRNALALKQAQRSDE